MEYYRRRSVPAKYVVDGWDCLIGARLLLSSVDSKTRESLGYTQLTDFEKMEWLENLYPNPVTDIPNFTWRDAIKPLEGRILIYSTSGSEKIFRVG